MKWKHYLLTSSAAVLLAGCAEGPKTTPKPVGEYCLISEPLYFADDSIVVWLSEHDPSLLEGITVHNEQVERVCS